MKKIKSILLLCIVIITITSCTKEGPTGPQGETGPQGPQGPSGNANMQTLNFSFDLSSLSSSAPEYNLICESPAITSEIIENGAVIGYIKSGAEWTSLPTWKSLGATIQIGYRPYLKTGQYRINIKRDDGKYIEKSDLSDPFEVKVILFP